MVCLALIRFDFVGRHIGLETVFVGLIEDLVLVAIGGDEAIAAAILHGLRGGHLFGVLGVIRLGSDCVGDVLIPLMTVLCVEARSLGISI